MHCPPDPAEKRRAGWLRVRAKKPTCRAAGWETPGWASPLGSYTTSRLRRRAWQAPAAREQRGAARSAEAKAGDKARAASGETGGRRGRPRAAQTHGWAGSRTAEDARRDQRYQQPRALKKKRASQPKPIGRGTETRQTMKRKLASGTKRKEQRQGIPLRCDMIGGGEAAPEKREARKDEDGRERAGLGARGIRCARAG